MSETIPFQEGFIFDTYSGTKLLANDFVVVVDTVTVMEDVVLLHKHWHHIISCLCENKIRIRVSLYFLLNLATYHVKDDKVTFFNIFLVSTETHFMLWKCKEVLDFFEKNVGDGGFINKPPCDFITHPNSCYTTMVAPFI